MMLHTGEGDSLDKMLRENEGGYLIPDPDVLEIRELGDQAVDLALSITTAAALLDKTDKELIERVYPPLFGSARGISDLKRLAAVCLVLALAKEREEREGEVNDAD